LEDFIVPILVAHQSGKTVVKTTHLPGRNTSVKIVGPKAKGR
jgi:hypothetical protein